MSNWILYDEFVERVRNHHHDEFSGLITGVSDSKHSFQVGFDHGEIVLLTYRIKKGLAALQLLTQIERAKITEHPNRDIPDITGDSLATSTILSHLVSTTLDQTLITATDISNLSFPGQAVKKPSVAVPGKLKVNARMQRIIEAAALRHFGPVGALVCEEHLLNPQRDPKAILKRIARDVGASKAEAQAFIDEVTDS